MILQIYPLITLLSLWPYCAGTDLNDDEKSGIIGEQHMTDRILSLYNITKEGRPFTRYQLAIAFFESLNSLTSIFTQSTCQITEPPLECGIRNTVTQPFPEHNMI